MRVRVSQPGGPDYEGDAWYPPIEGRPFVLCVTGSPECLLETDPVVAVLGEGFFVTKTGSYRVVLLEGPTLAHTIARRVTKV